MWHPANHCSLALRGKQGSERVACKMNVVYHRERRSVPTELSLHSLRGEGETFPGPDTRGSRRGILAEPTLVSPHEVQGVGPKGRGRGDKGGTYVLLHDASGSLVLRSGLVVYAKPE